MQKTYKVLDHGYVKYLDHMGDDGTIAMDARTSYDRRTPGEDRALLRRLMRDWHTSPFEMGVLKVEMKMPIFVARQIVRHRTASMNEVSARYTQLPNEMFVPKALHTQSKNNKQGRARRVLGRSWIADIQSTQDNAYSYYEDMLSCDVSREQARAVLPLATYTKFIWKMDLHNLLHFLQLRLDPHAQYECRVYAEALMEMVQELFPICAEAFTDYRLHSYTLSVYEVEALTNLLANRGTIDELKGDYVPTCMTESEWKTFCARFDL